MTSENRGVQRWTRWFRSRRHMHYLLDVEKGLHAATQEKVDVLARQAERNKQHADAMARELAMWDPQSNSLAAWREEWA